MSKPGPSFTKKIKPRKVLSITTPAQNRKRLARNPDYVDGDPDPKGPFGSPDPRPRYKGQIGVSMNGKRR